MGDGSGRELASQPASQGKGKRRETQHQQASLLSGDNVRRACGGSGLERCDDVCMYGMGIGTTGKGERARVGRVNGWTERNGTLAWWR